MIRIRSGLLAAAGAATLIAASGASPAAAGVARADTCASWACGSATASGIFYIVPAIDYSISIKDTNCTTGGTARIRLKVGYTDGTLGYGPWFSDVANCDSLSAAYPRKTWKGTAGKRISYFQVEVDDATHNPVAGTRAGSVG